MMMMTLEQLLFAAATILLTYGSVVGLPIEKSDDGEDSARKFWITKVGAIREELLGAQAIIVKDEELKAGAAECKPKKADARYSDKRYLMCAGSILTSRYILTSASCIHEATHIRHNVRAPLAAMIAPFSDTAQVLRISEYNIHPSYKVDPRDDEHVLHNVAVVKLTCRISKPNLKEVHMPTHRISEHCSEDNCFVTIIKKIGPKSHTMFETKAKDLPEERDKRELPETSDEIKESSDKDSYYIDVKEKVLDTWENKFASQILEISEKINNQSTENNGKSNLKIVRSISQGSDKSGSRSSKNSISKIDNNFDKKLSARSSDGTKGCPQTGSAVMAGNIQTSLIATSCDDRQPETAWRHTDLFDNLDWINAMLDNWKQSNQTRLGISTGGGCQTCIYNFFIDYSCKNKSMCRKEGAEENDQVEIKIPGIDIPKCAKNQTDQKNVDTRTSLSKNNTRNGNLAYLNAINEMYSNKRSDSKDDDQKLKSGLIRENTERNDFADFYSNPYANSVSGLLPRPLLNQISTSEITTTEYTANLDYFNKLDAYQRATKDVKSNAAERVSLKFPKRARKPKVNKKLSLEAFFDNDKYDKPGIPDEYATLYRKFLKLNKRH